MPRLKQAPGAPVPMPAPGTPWLIGAAIGMAILSMAGGAMALGGGLAMTQAALGKPPK